MPGPLKPYEVEVNGHTTTLMLSDVDAEQRGLIGKQAPNVVKKSARGGKQPQA